jgi:FtsH-binding integral membrane protein
MAALVTLLVYCQALGAGAGALTAVWSELAYIRAMKDGTIDQAERAHLDIIAHGLRWGMSLLLLSSLGLVVVAYALDFSLQPAMTTSYWVLIILAFIVVIVSWTLSRHKISFALGSATLFTAWWFIAYLTIGKLSLLTFGASAAFFVVATAIFYAILESVRFFVLDKTHQTG